MMNFTLEHSDLSLLRWVVQVASDALIIQVSDGVYPKDVGNTLIRSLSTMESRIVEALAENSQIPKPNTQPTLF